MKIVKRDGRIVEYDSDKIRTAINKANTEVQDDEKISQRQIESIIRYVEGLKKKRMLVEDVQDIIETKLMEMKKFVLAKQYIIYRYTRALVRKANTTDETILSLIKNNNQGIAGENSKRNCQIAAIQRDLIAGEVSKDLTKRLLLPDKIAKAHEEGKIYFHDADYFLQPIINNCYVDISNMLDNGTVMNEKYIESPKGFQVACTVMTQIIALVSSGQCGGQTIEIRHLSKYLRKSYNKFKTNLETKYSNILSSDQIEEIVQDRLKEELIAGVQTIQYQINTLMTTSGKLPFVTLFLNIDKEDEYLEENIKIIEEILRQRIIGIKDKNGEYTALEFPKLVYAISDINDLNGGKYDYLTELAIECAIKHGYPTFISEKIMKENNKGNVFSTIGNRDILPLYKDSKNIYKYEGRFNQGIVSINLPQIALTASKDYDAFWNMLEERLDLCFEALMCRHHALLGTNSDTSPIHWQYGAISRLEAGEKIDKLLKNGYSTISLGYIGLYETAKFMTGKSHVEEEGKDFANEVLKKLREACARWKEYTGLGFELSAPVASKMGMELINKDREIFGTIKEITDKESYTDSYHIPIKEKVDIYDDLEKESIFSKISSGGGVCILNIDTQKQSIQEIKDIIKYANEKVQYFKINEINNKNR